MNKRFTKGVAGTVMVPTILLAIVASPAGLFGYFGSQKASAADPRGDWSTQRDITRNIAQADCDLQGLRHFGCLTVDYMSSGPYGPNSRTFVWHTTYSDWTGCNVTVYIGNHNGIIGKEFGPNCT